VSADDWVYPTLDDFLRAASVALQTDPSIVRPMINVPLAESALGAPASGFGDHELYPSLPMKVAILLQRIASNHALPDGNKRTALLCAILFSNLNGLAWDPPGGDDPDGAETAEVVEAAAAGVLPFGALTAWVEDRLVLLAQPPRAGVDPAPAPENAALVSYTAEFIGNLPYENNTIRVGEHLIHEIHGYNPAAVYVRRLSGKTEGLSISEIIISVVGDGYAQKEVDAENAEAARYPLGPKEYWRGRMVGKYTYGPDGHLMTNEEFEADWAE
jgi:prophage maintenance system killer protein